MNLIENQENLEEMVKQNNGLIWSVVKKFSGSHYDLEDLYQIGSIGLIKAIRRFNPDYGYQLSTFAVPYIWGEIKKFIRDDGMIKISRNIKKDCKITIESINEIFMENGKEEKVERIIGKIDEQNKLIDKITLDAMVENLSLRDKRIIKMRYFKEKTQEQVAKALGISQVQVCRIEKKILNEMRANL
ncbi:MAG: sigma-70 family RNA polymerase sigma factor [Clostridia bacterium]|nr:sigma-70 family RNA polymerase sigma factor [Clostridia bacterium]